MDDAAHVRSELFVADTLTDRASRVAQASLAAVKLLLQQPDTESVRVGVLSLLESLCSQVYDAAEAVREAAERAGVDCCDVGEIKAFSAIGKAARAAGLPTQ